MGYLGSPLASLLLAAVTLAGGTQVRYFDAHNHFTGILPYRAYADLPAFIRSLSHPAQRVPYTDRLALYRYLRNVWYPKQGAALDDRPFSPSDGQRYALGARAALLVYQNRVAGSTVDLDGVLERVLTATPWSEFDSAYAFRGGPASEYLRQRFYGGSWHRLEADLCKATVLDLAATHIADSEQSLPFIGGWHFQNGYSDKLATIACVMNAPRDSSVTTALHAMRKPMPIVKFVLMTHTSQLATLPGGETYSEWSKSGNCQPVPLPKALITTPKTIENALLGLNDAGKPIVSEAQRSLFFDSVVGIDTAGPETTCFTGDGMAYYDRLAAAVYDAAKARRALGWRGKLLVHTHVGEGASIKFSPKTPAEPWTFAGVFGSLPPARTNDEQAHENVAMLLRAVATFEKAHPDAHDYVIFRFAHDTWADRAQAAQMRDEGVEADVNLESNVATGAYPLSRMPLGLPLIMRFWIAPEVANERSNFALNDLLGVLVRNPENVRQVGGILGNTPLKYMLEEHVRCLLGTDADGVEHSDIVKEYEYAGSLIRYWNATDPQFRASAAGISEKTLFDNVDWHLSDMSTDSAERY